MKVLLAWILVGSGFAYLLWKLLCTEEKEPSDEHQDDSNSKNNTTTIIQEKGEKINGRKNFHSKHDTRPMA